MSKKKVIVVGAGINGLVISNYLSRDNFDVLLLEKSERVGGACVSDSVNINNDKVTFAKGATVLGMMPRLQKESTKKEMSRVFKKLPKRD